MVEFLHESRIPKDRIAVLIGKDGATKKQIEGLTHTHLDVDSKEGDVFIKGADAIDLFSTREIVKAIARGFNPEIALSLTKQDNVLEVIALSEFVNTDNKNAMGRIKGRVIGTDGKTRRIIEELTLTHLCVYGKTISLIGEPANVAAAKKAVESLLSGSPHASVYSWLERQAKDLRRREFGITEIREPKAETEDDESKPKE